jgi:carbon-monoxide dehydrogenase medium subunit
MNGLRSIGSFKYVAPKSLGEALHMLHTKRGDTKVLNGGTDLVAQMKQGLVSPSSLLDIKGLPELNRLEWDDTDGLHIGAAVTFSRFLSCTALPKDYSILTQVCSVIGSVQIKNRGTIGGNICNAAPSADSLPPLLCLDARAVLASHTGTRTIPLNGFFTAPGRTSMDDDELLIEIEVPPPPARSAGCYVRHTTREEMDIAVAGVAAWLALSSQHNRLRAARIALGAVAATPMRARDTESSLKGKPVTLDAIEEASEVAAGEAKPISDLRGSAEYRRELVRVLTRRTLKSSCKMLGIKI